MTRHYLPLVDRGPLRVMFLMTSMPVGGAETLLVNLIRRMDRTRFLPELCCLKSFGPLGEVLAKEVPAFEHLIHHKFDFFVWRRLARLFRQRRIDAVITVGAGDKMFWGRLAAWSSGTPVVMSAIHSTGWPDGIGRLNRQLTLITDKFIGVAAPHGRHLIDVEGFPAHKVCVIPNGVDVERFHGNFDREKLRASLGIAPDAPVAGIVAALRPEKNHELLLQAAARVHQQIPAAQFLIVGDGPERPQLEQLTAKLGITGSVHFLGTRSDIPELLAALDVFVLTSHIEANPVSILEAMASCKPVVAPRVGSIADSVADGTTGYLCDAGQKDQFVARLVELLGNPVQASQMGAAGRQVVVDRWSLERMVEGYERQIEEIYTSKASSSARIAADCDTASIARG